MADPTETELKLRIPALVAATAIDALRRHPAIEAAARGPWRVARIDNRYFDTPDRALAARRMALRIRRIGRAWVQTLKASGDAPASALSTRREWEMPIAGPVFALAKFVDTPLGDLGSARTLARALEPVFTTNFRRESRIVAVDDVEIEIAIDRGTIATGRGKRRRTEPICELELEILASPETPRSSAHATLLRFAQTLAHDVALLPLAASKASRGYRLAAGVPPVPAKVETPTTSRDAAAKDHAVAIVSACHDVALRNLHAMHDLLDAAATGSIDAAGRRLADLDPEFVHQARVAVRKLRTATRVFAAVLGRRRARRIDDAWRDVGRALGGLRDWDVMLESLPELGERVGAASGGTLSTTHARREAAVHVLVDDLVSPVPGLAALFTERALERVATRVDARSSSDVAVAWLDAQQDRIVARARRIAVLDDDERHRLRIDVKRLRYALEFFDGLFDDKEHRDLLGDLQDALGKLVDAVVQRDRIGHLVDPDAVAHALVTYDHWLHGSKKKRLPKIAALAVRLELEARPWHVPRAAGPAQDETRVV